MAPARGVGLGLAVLLLGSGCSLLDRGRGLVFEEQPAEEPDPGPATPRTIQERHPYMRFIEHGNGQFTTIATVPAGAGAEILKRLKDLCTMDDGYEPVQITGEPPRNNPKLWLDANAGGMIGADAMLKPWSPPVAGSVNWRSVEDLILIKGSEVEIEEVLDALDLWYNASPQIEIQANVFDVTNSEAFERGITQANGQPLLENTDPKTFWKALGGNFPSSSSPGFGAGTGTAGLGGVFRLGFIDADFQLDAYLQFLEQEGILDIVASPSIVTRNGVPAIIESTEEVPFLQPGQIAFGGNVVFTIGTKTVGVKLNVVPFLVGADSVHLNISAEVSRLSREIVVGVDAANNPIAVPGTSRRTATTSVIVKQGQRVVIGGLKLIETRRSQSRIPFLGQIPLIGWLFSNDSEEQVTTDVYFVIEPKVRAVPTIEKIGDIFDPFENQ